MAEECTRSGEDEDLARSNRTTPGRDEGKRRDAGEEIGAQAGSIEPSREREVARVKRGDGAEPGSPAADPARPPKKRSHEVGDVPEEVANRYYSEGRMGRRDYFADAQGKEAAFRDGGGNLSADRTDPAVISDMLKVAQHRGWDEISVSGSQEFRREVWIQAQELGVEVRGYKPSERDRQDAERRALERQNVHGGQIDDARNVKGGRDRQEDSGAARPNGGRTTAGAERVNIDPGVSGKLVELGEAPYKGRADEAPHPFVKVQDDNGQTRTLWGVGLPQALKDAGAEIGDRVIVRRDGVDQVMKKVMMRDPETRQPIKDPETGRAKYEQRAVTRNVWAVTAEKFRTGDREERASDPALRGPESQMRAVETYVKDRVHDPAAQERLLTGARDRIAGEIERGAAFDPARVASREREREIAGERSGSSPASRVQDRAANANPAKVPELSIAAKAQQEVIRRRDQERERER